MPVVDLQRQSDETEDLTAIQANFRDRSTFDFFNRIGQEQTLRKADDREISAHDSVSGKSAFLNGFLVIRFRQSAARDLKGTLALCADRRAQMREHQMLRARPFSLAGTNRTE